MSFSGQPVVPQYRALSLRYDPSVGTSTISYEANLLETAFADLSPLVLGGIIAGEAGANVGETNNKFWACVHDPKRATTEPEKVSDNSAACLLLALPGAGVLHLGGLVIRTGVSLLRDAVVRVLKGHLQQQARGAPGEITLLTALPAVGPQPAPAPAPDRQAVASYDRLAAGAPHHGYFIAPGRTSRRRPIR